MALTLAHNEVFVFGSNAQGFHGNGAAGLACRGDHRLNWKQDQWFLNAMQSPPGSPDRIGQWAIFGIARGHQVGRSGESYAIQTILRPGLRRSTPLYEIYAQLLELWHFAKLNPSKTLVISPLGQGYAGYTPNEMHDLWTRLQHDEGNRNCRFTTMA